MRKGQRLRERFDETLGYTVKRCSRCREEKALSEFFKRPTGLHSRCKSCELAAAKTRYDAQPEKYRAKARDWHRDNRERGMARSVAWREHNHERALTYYRDYYVSHVEQRRADTRRTYQRMAPEARALAVLRKRLSGYYPRYYLLNKARVAARGRLWRRTFPERHTEIQNRRRAHINGAPAVERIDRMKIVERDGWTCYRCGIVCTRVNVTLDHIVPLSRGGSHTADNLRVCCRTCNCRKGTKLLHELLHLPS